MLRLILLSFSMLCGSIDCRSALRAEAASYQVCGSSLGIGDTYGDAYAQARLNIPYDASVYDKNIFKPFRDGDKWQVTLMWRKVKN